MSHSFNTKIATMSSSVTFLLFLSFVCLYLSLVSWFRLRGCPGETVTFPPWNQDASGHLHPRSVFGLLYDWFLHFCLHGSDYTWFFLIWFGLFTVPGGPHSQFPAEWNGTTAGLVKMGFAVLMGLTPLLLSYTYTHTLIRTQNRQTLMHLVSLIVC